METVLKVAVQKKGRLSEKTLELLSNCGIKISTNGSRLKVKSDNFPLEILFLRDDDIPGYVANGVADIGIVGENVTDEKKCKVNRAHKLGFAKCRLSLAIPRRYTYNGVEYLNDKRIATSYPNILQKFLNDNAISAEISEISGSVEIAPTIGLTDAICDIVSTGGTLLANGLKEVHTIYKSEAELIAYPFLNKDKQNLLNQLITRIKAVNRAKEFKYIVLNAPNNNLPAINNILPGMKSPTVTPLTTEGWSSVSSVVKEEAFWGIMEQLHDAGAEGILVMPIEKMVY
jgi:ATP phosphoribosyltransferase